MRCTVNSLTPMTYILASHCADGIVLLSDRKVTIEGGIEVEYEDKIFSEFEQFLLTYAGSRETFGSFRMKLQDTMSFHVNAYGQMTLSNMYNMISDTMFKLSGDYRSYEKGFEILVVSKDSKEPIRHFIYDGRPSTVRKYKAIGTGSPYGAIMLKNCWKPDMTMTQSAELGCFIIRYIEKNRLDLTVGVGDFNPQVWFIPRGGERRELQKEEICDLQTKIDEKISRLNKSITEIWNQ
jgi:20S proteasome alpha/beta subunit